MCAHVWPLIQMAIAWPRLEKMKFTNKRARTSAARAQIQCQNFFTVYNTLHSAVLSLVRRQTAPSTEKTGRGLQLETHGALDRQVQEVLNIPHSGYEK